VSFALAANELVTRRAASTAIELPLRMGWAVTLGEAAIGWHSPSREAIHGDAVNLAFRLASIAGREGNPPVLAADEVALAAANAADYGEPRQVHAKGRTTAATVRAAERRA
jgi:class 3 adenylate cyclase